MSKLIHYLFQHWGYWTVLAGILLEDAGVPVPGETILITAAILARTQHQLSIPVIGAIAVAAAITGDNLGFALGHYGGRPFLRRYQRFFHIDDQAIEKGESIFKRHGPVAVFFARFIAVLRIVAGPLAGTLRMSWRSFLIFNSLGAIAWVTAVCTLAFLLGPSLEPLIKHSTWVVLGLTGLAVAGWFWRRRHRR